MISPTQVRSSRPHHPASNDLQTLQALRTRVVASPGPLEAAQVAAALQALTHSALPQVRQEASALLRRLAGETPGPLQAGRRRVTFAALQPQAVQPAVPQIPVRTARPAHAAAPAHPAPPQAPEVEGPKPAPRAAEIELPDPAKLAAELQQHPLLQAVPAALRADVMAASERIMRGDGASDEALRLLAFFANTPIDRNLGGMHSPRAVWLVWNSLHRVASEGAFDPPEKAVLARLLHMYQGYYATAVLNAFFRAAPHHLDAYSALLQEHLLPALLRPGAPQALHTGYPGHAVVMRLTLSHTATGNLRAGREYRAAQTQIREHLGLHADTVVGRRHGRALLLDTVFHDTPSKRLLADPRQNGWLDAHSCVIHSAKAPHQVRVTSVDAETQMQKTVTVDIDDLRTHLEDRGLNPLPNTVKLTLHNGGSGAKLLPDGRTKTYDRRLLLPLPQAAAKIAAIQEAAAANSQIAAVALQEALGFGVDDRMSRTLSPDLSAQHLGNCTVHSQKLFLMYELQHLSESNTPLSSEHGTRLFERLWPAMFADAMQRFAQGSKPDDSFTKSLLARAARVLKPSSPGGL